MPGQRNVQPGTGSAQKSIRVQHRKTKRERNHAKFGRKAEEKSLTQRGSDGAFQRVQIPHLGTRPSSGPQGTCLSNPVIITQSRLTQHQGMFNREVKSADIGRLLGWDKDLAETPSEKSPRQREGEGDRGGAAEPLLEEGTIAKSSNPAARAVRSRTAVPVSGSMESERTKEKKLLSSVEKPATEPHSANRSLHPTQSPAPGGPAEGTTDPQTLGSLSTSDKENTPLGRAALDQRRAPVKEVAQKLLTLLNLPAVFPGRSLINETRQSIMAILLDRYGKVPDISALTVCRRLDYSLTPNAQKGGCRSVSSGDGQHTCEKGAGRKDPCWSHCGKRRRKPSSPLPFGGAPEASSSAPAGAIAAEGSQSQKKDLDLFEELRIHGRHRQCFTSAVHFELPSMLSRCTGYSRPGLPVGRDHTELDQDLPHLAVSRLESRRRETLEECFLPRNPSQTVWDTRSNLERNTDAFRHALKRNKTCSLPFNLSDSTATCSPRFIIGRNPDICENTEAFPFQQQVPHRHMACSPNTLWGLMERENPKEPVLRSGLAVQAQDVFGNQEPQTGWKSLERISLENPKSFDVLRSVWSSDIHCEGGGCSGAKAFDLAHPCGAVPSRRCCMSYREPCPNQGPQPKPNNVVQVHPRPRHSEEVYLSGHKVKDCGHCTAVSAPGNTRGIQRDKSSVYSYVPDTRACHQKSIHRVLGDHRRAQPCVASWDPGSSTVRDALPFGHHDHGGKHCQSTGEYCYTTEHRGFPKLPLSFFPPSEALEQSLTLTPRPYSASTGPLLERSSPESWVFPRMKLY